MKTAIEEVIDKIKRFQKLISNSSQKLGLAQAMDILEDFKELEKEKLINFHIEVMKKGLIDEGEQKWLEIYKPKITKIAEQYYNETFNR
jgi:TPP-dependent 2-oxoacid decarboxylase